MTTTTYPPGHRPRIRVTNDDGSLSPLPNLTLVKINSKTAYFRSSHVVGEMAVDVDKIEIIRHADGRPYLDSERWPALTPYDTGERLQPMVWVSPDPRRPEEYDRDRYGKVDFNDDEDATRATIHIEKVETCYIVHIYSHETDSEARINLSADLGAIQARIVADRPVVLMRDGETFEGDDVDVIDITDLVDPNGGGEYTTEDALGIADTLRAAGYESEAEEIEGLWA